MRLTGYSRVAVIKIGYKAYGFALYDNNIDIGDSVIVTGNSEGQPLIISDIVSPEEGLKLTGNKGITAEVICKVDCTTYYERVKKREKAREIKIKLDNEIHKLQKEEPYETYSAKSPIVAELYRMYKELVQ